MVVILAIVQLIPGQGPDCVDCKVQPARQPVVHVPRMVLDFYWSRVLFVT